MDTLDWTLIRSFIAVAETGSLSAAARQIGQSQPTIGRHITLMNEALGVSLFTRHSRGLALTEAGTELMPAAQTMREAAARLELAAVGQTQRLEGTIRISTSVVVAHFHMPAIIARLREKAPGIEVELLPSDSTENLLFREADIAVRMYRPTELDIIARHLGEIDVGMFAATSYLDRKGRPISPEDIANHTLIGLDRSDLLIRGMRQHGLNVSRNDFAVRCDDQAANWQLLRAGCGIGFGQASVALHDPGIERVLPGLAIPTLPVWLAAPQALKRSPRIRFVFDFLVQQVSALCIA